jgi:hypothetical protein
MRPRADVEIRVDRRDRVASVPSHCGGISCGLTPHVPTVPLIRQRGTLGHSSFHEFPKIPVRHMKAIPVIYIQPDQGENSIGFGFLIRNILMVGGAGIAGCGGCMPHADGQ